MGSLSQSRCVHKLAMTQCRHRANALNQWREGRKISRTSQPGSNSGLGPPGTEIAKKRVQISQLFHGQFCRKNISLCSEFNSALGNVKIKTEFLLFLCENWRQSSVNFRWLPEKWGGGLVTCDSICVGQSTSPAREPVCIDSAAARGKRLQGVAWASWSWLISLPSGGRDFYVGNANFGSWLQWPFLSWAKKAKNANFNRLPVGLESWRKVAHKEGGITQVMAKVRWKSVDQGRLQRDTCRKVTQTDRQTNIFNFSIRTSLESPRLRRDEAKSRLRRDSLLVMLIIAYTPVSIIPQLAFSFQHISFQH
jgi:hypothetical protein